MKKEKGWKLLKKEKIIAHPYIMVENWHMRLPNGEEKEFMVGGSPYDFVVVVALTSKKKFVVIKQFYISEQKKIPSLVAGIVDKGERALKTAARELKEETGYKAKKMIALGKGNKGKYTTGTVHYFLGLEAERVGEPALEEAEDIDVEEVSFQQFKKIINDYLLKDPFCEVGAQRALDYLKKHHIV